MIEKGLDTLILNTRLAALPFRKFFRYLTVGALATAVDWAIFYLCAVKMNLHYQTSVAISLSIATVFHYAMNKFFTFKCASKKIALQLAAHLGVSIVYVAASMGAMYLLVDVLVLDKMLSKMLTTGVMTVAGYFLSSRVTFNKRFFQ